MSEGTFSHVVTQIHHNEILLQARSKLGTCLQQCKWSHMQLAHTTCGLCKVVKMELGMPRPDCEFSRTVL